MEGNPLPSHRTNTHTLTLMKTLEHHMEEQ